MAGIKLGDVVRDSVSGFTGKVTSDCTRLFGTRRLEVTSQTMYEGKILEEWFEIDRLENVGGT